MKKIILLALGVGLAGCGGSKESKTESNSLGSTSEIMSFEKCSSVQNEMTNALKGTQYKVLAIVDTDIAIMRKYCTNDGAIILTCSKPDLKLVTTKSTDMTGC